MTHRTSHAHLATLLIAGVALAATAGYVTPWYVNPALKDRFWLGVDNFTPTGLAIGADATRLAIAAKPDGASDIIRVYDLGNLVYTANVVQTNRHVTAYTASTAGLNGSPRLAVNTNGLVGVDAAGSAAAKFTFESRKWVGRYAPEARTFAAAPDATSFALDSTGALWSNATGAGREGLLVKRTLSGTAYAEADTVATGLTAVDAVAVYTVNGVEYALAAAQGKVVRVNVSTKAVATLVDDATHLDAAVNSVKMSHTDYFRPRLYVLLATGDIAVYYLNKTATTATWSKTLTNAELLTVAQAPYAATDAVIEAFEVTPDGGSAFLSYKANEGATATGPCTLAMVKHKAPSWRYYAAGEAGNPSQTPDTTACITDGKWVLRCTLNSSAIKVGVDASTRAGQRAWDDDNFHEYLDMSIGYAKNVSGTSYNITGNASWAFMTNDFGRIPRVIIFSPNKSDGSSQSFKGVSDAEEVVVESTGLTSATAWLGFYSTNKRIVLNLANLKTADETSFYQNNGQYYSPEAGDSDFIVPKLATVKKAAFAYFCFRGLIDLPSAVDIYNTAFWRCNYMTELRLGAEKKTLKSLDTKAFGVNAASDGHLKRVVLGGAAGFTFKATDVFLNQPLEEVVFTGTVPEFPSGTCWPDKAIKTLTFVVPRGNADWDAILTDTSKVTPLTEAEQKAYRLANPSKPIPYGVVKKDVFHTAYDQYIAYAGGECALTIDHDTFFDDTVEVSGDWGASASNSYPYGATVTITARPGATGIFKKWYGDVPRDDMDIRTNATLALTMTNDVYLYARFVHPWTLASDKKTAYNGNFTINCSVVNASQRTLKVGKDNVRYGIYADDDVGQGILDLGGPVRLEGDAAEWKFVDMPWSYSTWTAPMTANVTGLITPGTVTTGMWGQFLHTYDAAQSYRLLFIDEPKMGSTIGGWTTASQNLVMKFILELPQLKSLTGQGAVWGIPMKESKFDWWNVDNVTQIDVQALGGYSDVTGTGDWANYLPGKGTLSLPSMRAANVAALQKMRNLEGLSLGGKDKYTTVTNICANAFQGDTSLKRLTLHGARELTVGATPFSSGYSPTEFVFTGPSPASETSFANLLSRATAAEKKPVKVYASILQDGWTTDSYIDHNPTAAERAEAPGERVIGVYRGGAEAPLGKALIIFRKSRFDAPGTVLIFK